MIRSQWWFVGFSISFFFQAWFLFAQPEEEPTVTVEESTEPVVEERPITLLSAGDTHFTWGVTDLQKKETPDAPFREVYDLFQSADISMLNLETAIASEGVPLLEKAYIFNADTRNLAVLNSLGLDVAVLGNNHAMDMGSEGLLSSIQNLKDAGIQSVGAGKNLTESIEPVFIEKDSIKFAILSFSFIGDQTIFASGTEAGIAPARFAYTAIRKAKATSDIVIVQLHWGGEYEARPDLNQINFARKCILSGASAIIGHHPHIPGAVELYRGGVIVYSLGNFVFGSVTRLQTNNMIALLDIDRKSKRVKNLRLQGITGIFGDTGHSVKKLEPVEARKLWARIYVQTNDFSPLTANRFEILEDGQLQIPIE